MNIASNYPIFRGVTLFCHHKMTINISAMYLSETCTIVYFISRYFCIVDTKLVPFCGFWLGKLTPCRQVLRQLASIRIYLRVIYITVIAINQSVISFIYNLSWRIIAYIQQVIPNALPRVDIKCKTTITLSI